MKFGIRLASDIGDTARLLRLGVLADRHGFDFCWATHDLFKRSCFVTLSALASQTDRIMLGSAILNPYTINPAEIAMFAATLNEIAKGRVVLGISAGGIGFFQWIGVETPRPLQRTRECITLLRRLLRGERAQFNGREFRWNEQAYLRIPAPAQPVPIYVGGQGPAMLGLAGAEADGALPILFPPEFVGTAMARIKTGAENAGRHLNGFDTAGCVWFSISDKREVAEHAIKRLAAYYGPHIGQDTLAAIGLDPGDFAPVAQVIEREGIDEAAKIVDDGVLRLAIVGNADDCIDQVEKLVKAGVTQLNIGPPLGPDPERAVELIAKQIMPHFRN